MNVLLKKILKFLVAILIIIPAGLAAALTNFDILEGIGMDLWIVEGDIILLIFIFGLYIVSAVWVIRMLFAGRFKTVAILVLCGMLLASVSLILPKHSYFCHTGDSSAEIYQTRGWPIGMIRVGNFKVDCVRGTLAIALNIVFWSSIASVFVMIKRRKQQNRETSIPTQ